MNELLARLMLCETLWLWGGAAIAGFAMGAAVLTEMFFRFCDSLEA